MTGEDSDPSMDSPGLPRSILRVPQAQPLGAAEPSEPSEPAELAEPGEMADISAAEDFEDQAPPKGNPSNLHPSSCFGRDWRSGGL